MNNTITEKKNTLEGINTRITEAEERISELKDRIVEITTTETFFDYVIFFTIKLYQLFVYFGY